MDPSLPQIHGVPLTEPNITIVPAGGNQKPFILRFMYYGIDHPHNVPQNFKAHKVAEAASEILKQHDGIEMKPTDIFEYYKQATADARLVSWKHTPVTQSIANQLHDKDTVNTTTPFLPDAVTEAILSPDTQVLLAHVRRLAHENPLEDLVKALDVVQSPPHIPWNFWPSRNASTENTPVLETDPLSQLAAGANRTRESSPSGSSGGRSRQRRSRGIFRAPGARIDGLGGYVKDSYSASERCALSPENGIHYAMVLAYKY